MHLPVSKTSVEARAITGLRFDSMAPSRPTMSRSAPVRYTVAVRELCEFAAKSGDLDHRFTPSPTAHDGIVGHQVVAARRGSTRRNEVAVCGDYKALHVRGRADGFIESEGTLEEVKTYRGSLDNIPANRRALHLAQAKVYAALICQERKLSSLKVALVYYEITRQEETSIVEAFSAEALQAFFETLCEAFLDWAVKELAHRRLRNGALGALRFSHPSFRAGQRELAVNVFRAVRLGRHLMAQAPTGIGKTVGTIFPLLKACATEGLDKIFFLTAKGSGRQLAADALMALRRANPGMPLRTIEIVAREKACEHPGKACHGDACPLARGFYDRLPAARAAAITGEATLNQGTVRQVARDHAVCPYYLTQELVRWSDVVIADYNYFFDSTASLHLLTLANEWKVAILVDEAHNLLERARAMYTAELSETALEEARAVAAAALQGDLQILQRAWRDVSRSQSETYAVQPTIPEAFAAALGRVTAAITTQLAEDPATLNPVLLRFYFDALHFNRMADAFGAHSLFDVTLTTTGGRSSDLCIRNVVPAPFLRQRFAAARTAILFSATLSPHQFYADTLGLDEATAWLDVGTPFETSQLRIHIVDHISTKLADRADSLVPIAELVARQYAMQPGNYLVFLSSFDYLERAAAVFQALCPDIPMWSQERRGDERSRVSYLAQFTVDGRGVGFAVLGGAFAEGIDLPGSRLIGAFIATLGLPQVNAINEETRRRQQQTFGSGYDYTYLFPGLRKVVQAAGRVIRTPTDTGTLYLIDQRFNRPEVRALLPTWWTIAKRHPSGLAGTGHH